MSLTRVEINSITELLMDRDGNTIYTLALITSTLICLCPLYMITETQTTRDSAKTTSKNKATPSPAARGTVKEAGLVGGASIPMIYKKMCCMRK